MTAEANSGAYVVDVDEPAVPATAWVARSTMVDVLQHHTKLAAVEEGDVGNGRGDGAHDGA